MAESTKITLTETMEKTRTAIGFLGVFLVLLTIWQIGKSLYLKALPPESELVLPEPNYAFGAMPAIQFPTQSTSSKPTSYQLMINGITAADASTWPTFGNYQVIEVYKLKPLAYSLTADQKARDIAKNLDFDREPQIIDSRTYLFTYPGPPLEESLEIDLKTMFMTLTTNYLTTTNIFGVTFDGVKSIPDRVGAIAAVRNYLNQAGILPADLSDAAATVSYRKATGSQLEPVENYLEADYVSVSLPRTPLSGLRDQQPTEYKFYGPDDIGSVYGIVGKDLDGVDIVVNLEDYYYQLDTSNVATYYLRTAQAAWQNVQAGDAYVINPRGIKNAVIRSVELGYYESHQEQEYLLPIYVFSGDNDVKIYVQALHPNLIQN